MKKIIFTSLLFTSVLILSCKKETLNIPSDKTVDNNSPITNGLPSKANLISGALLASKLYFPSMNFTTYYSYAGFFRTSVPFTNANPLSFLILGDDYADTVKINNTVLKFGVTGIQNNPNLYSDTSSCTFSNTVNWFVKGNSKFTSFNTAVTRGFPIITNPAIVPLVFSKTQPLTINLSSGNISNADSIIVEIQDNTGNGFSITKSVAGATSSINFTSNELSGLATGPAASQIFIYTKNYSHVVVNSKTHVFIMCYTLSEYQTINP